MVTRVMNETAPFVLLKFMIAYHAETGHVVLYIYNQVLGPLLSGGSCLAQKTV